MALDKQRILTELGSVVNQLQSADCGCMGKLFSSPGQGSMGSPPPAYGGCQRTCCHNHGGYNYGHSNPFAGEPYSPPANVQSSNVTHCMGQCNPPKLYADTYHYLNENLMQPAVREVYNDLKSINPTNTIMNNPLGSQMGLTPGAGGTQGQANRGHMAQAASISDAGRGYNQTNSPGNAGMQYQGNMRGMNQTSSPGGVRGTAVAPGNAYAMSNQLGGMGPQIMNVMMSGGGDKPSNLPTQKATPNIVNAQQPAHGAMGTPSSNTYNNGNINYGQNNAIPNLQNPTQQYVAQTNPMPSNAIGNSTMNTIPTGNPIRQHIPATNNQSYGMHTAGVTKFNEIFPGVMNNDDLGFDPMSIAIQMNPENQQKAAMNTIQKMVTGNFGMSGNKTSVPEPRQNLIANPVTNGQTMVQQAVPVNQTPDQVQNTQPMVAQQVVPSNQMQNVQGSQPYQVPPQQVYTAVTQPSNVQQILPQQQAQQQIVDSNASNVPVPQDGKNDTDLRQLQAQTPKIEDMPVTRSVRRHRMENMEPIFPVDTSKNRMSHNLNSQYVQYNTLGQPFERTNPKIYETPLPPLPQTLSPQPMQTKVGENKYSNVKSTVSKTSILANPIGKAPNRNQLQNIYNQYKTSHSFTHQNIVKTPPVQGGTHSDGKLQVNSANADSPRTLQAPMEIVGGDTIDNIVATNKLLASQKTEKEDPKDITSPKTPQGDGAFNKETPVKRPSRNGLQDVVYTNYPKSTAWSFHGGRQRLVTPTATMR